MSSRGRAGRFVLFLTVVIFILTMILPVSAFAAETDPVVQTDTVEGSGGTDVLDGEGEDAGVGNQNDSLQGTDGDSHTSDLGVNNPGSSDGLTDLFDSSDAEGQIPVTGSDDVTDETPAETTRDGSDPDADDEEEPMGPVAMVGDIEYNSYEEALNAIQDGQTLVILTNDENAPFIGFGWEEGPSGTFYLDLGGNTLMQEFRVYDGADVTIKNGILEGDASVSGGKLTIASNATVFTAGVGLPIDPQTPSTLVIDGRVGYVDEDDVFNPYEVTVTYGTLEVKEGAVVGTIEVAAGSPVVNLTGGTVAEVSTAGDSPEVNISGGSINSINIAGGNGETALAISGGTIESLSVTSENADIAISGGTFSAEIPEEYCVDGYSVQDNGNGTFSVSENGVITDQLIVTLSSQSVMYTGADSTPDFTVKSGETDLVEGTDYYAVWYNSNGTAVRRLINEDTYTLKVTGAGDYSRLTASETFRIYKDTELAWVDGILDDYRYGGAVELQHGAEIVLSSPEATNNDSVNYPIVYKWWIDGELIESREVTVNRTGGYTCEITDGTGRSLYYSVGVFENSGLAWADGTEKPSIAEKKILQPGESLQVTAPEVTNNNSTDYPIVYTWTHNGEPFAQGATITVDEIGDYYCDITDGSSAMLDYELSVTYDSGLAWEDGYEDSIRSETENKYIQDGNSITITAPTAINSNSIDYPIEYAWSNGEKLKEVTIDSIGKYSCVITDGSGNRLEYSVTVTYDTATKITIDRYVINTDEKSIHIEGRATSNKVEAEPPNPWDNGIAVFPSICFYDEDMNIIGGDQSGDFSEDGFPCYIDESEKSHGIGTCHYSEDDNKYIADFVVDIDISDGALANHKLGIEVLDGYFNSDSYDFVVPNIITFDSAGGSTVAAQTVEYKGTVTKPEDPTKDGYEFLGWFEGDEPYDFTSPVTGNIALTAKWAVEYAAQVGDVKYETFAEAADAANGEVITLLKRITDAYTMQSADEVLKVAKNGKTITVKAPEGLYVVASSTMDGVTTYTVVDATFEITKANGTVSYSNSFSLLNGNGSIVKLLKDFTSTSCPNCGSSMYKNCDVILDLNGHNLSINSTTRDYCLLVTQNNTLTIKNGTIDMAPTSASKSNGIRVESGSTLNIGSDVTINAHNGVTAVTVLGSATLNTSCILTAENSFAIAGSGSEGNGGYTVNISGGEISATNVPAIYHPNSGVVTISDGAVTGSTAVYQKSGTLNITGGTLKGTGSAAEYTYNGNGANATGDALVIDNCGYPGGAPSVAVTGGTFISDNAKAVASYAYGDGNVAVGEFVSGGEFSNILEDNYVVEGKVPTQTQDASGMYTVTTDATVTFDTGDGGSAVKTQTVVYGNTAVEPKDPTKEGCTFKGWTLDGAAYSFDTAVTANIELKAVWEINKYTVKFVDEDGTELISTEYDFGTAAASVTAPSNPAKAADAQYTYTFAGWTPEIANVTADATYTATYTSVLKKYTVKFVGEDGAELSSAEYGYGTAAADITVPEAPAKAADAHYTYTFDGWTPEIADVTADAEYTATYTATVNEYTVTFNSDGGSEVAEQTVKYNEMATEPEAPTKVGYTFGGWTLGGEAYDFAAAVTADITLTAKWTKDVAEINGVRYGSLEEAIAAAQAGDTVKLLENTAEAPQIAKDVTIDLNGKSLMIAPEAMKVTDGEVSIRNGAIVSDVVDAIEVIGEGTKLMVGEDLMITTSASAFYIENKGELVIAGADILTDGIYTPVYGDGDSTITMTSGTVRADGNTSAIGVNTGKINISGGTVYSADLAAVYGIGETSEVNISGGEIKGASEGVQITDGCKGTITDGTITGEANEAIGCGWAAGQKPAELTVTDGTINGDVIVRAGSSAAIEGGVFNTDEFNAAEGTTLTITGGYFKNDEIDETMLHEGKTLVPAADKEGYYMLADLYTVQFVDYDGTVISSVEYADGTAAADVEVPADPERALDAYTYTFIMWTPTVGDVTGDATYKAVYNAVPTKITVTFESDGETVSTQSVDYGTKAVEPKPPVKDGYTFGG